MKETEKLEYFTDVTSLEKYFSGSVLDIGCGSSPITIDSHGFDINDGDANFILDYKEKLSYDTVFSSHCLEHMIDAKKSFWEWFQLVKPNGYYITVVPDYELYEQNIWPSLFNDDHKWAFSMISPSKDHIINIEDLIVCLGPCEIEFIKIQDDYYDYKYNSKIVSDKKRLRKLFEKFIAINRKTIASDYLSKTIFSIMNRLNIPIDQTLWKASAHIIIVAKKKSCE